MRVTCKCCGKEIEVYKGNCKYCANCRGEIYSKAKYYGGYSKAAKALIEIHEDERSNNIRLNKLRKRHESIADVVHEAMLHCRSYGREVAVMEGRVKK